MTRYIILIGLLIVLFSACKQENKPAHNEVVKLEKSLDQRGDSIHDLIERKSAMTDESLKEALTAQDSSKAQELSKQINQLEQLKYQVEEWHVTFREISSKHGHHGHDHNHDHNAADILSDEQLAEVLRDMKVRLDEIETEMNTLE